ncbi:MAG: putative Ig domain-containing protein [bacterium]
MAPWARLQLRMWQQGPLPYRPDENANGSDCFTFKVNDGLEDSNIATVMVTINPINDAPTISGTPQTAVEEDMPYSFTPSVNDPDVGDTLSFSIENKPGWASFSTTIGALSGTPGNDDIGTIPGIVITVIDANGASNSLPPFDLTVVKVDTDLEIRMTVDNLTHSVDATIIFTITVTNNSPRDTTGVQVIDILPLGLRYVSDDSEGSYDKDTGKWNIGNLSATAPNNTVSLNITATVIHQGEIVNIASITDSEVTDSDITNNSFGLILNGGSQADLAIEKTVNNPVPIAGDTVTFTIIVTNNGVDDTTRMQVTDVLPTGLTYRSNTPFQGTYDSNTGIWDVGNLNEGDSATLQLTATVNNENELISTARISRSDQIDPDTTNNESSVIINQDTINHPFIADLSIQKIVNQRVINVEDEVVFTLLVRNNGPDDANNVKINDLLPDGLTYISSEPSQGVYLEETGIWEIGTISAASYVIMDIVVKVIDAALQTNIAAISNLNEVDTYTGNDSDEVTVRRLQADISVKKSVDDQNPIIGNNIVFTITVENKGPDDATGIQIIDLLPAGLKYLDDNSGGSYDSGTGVWDIAGLANGASASLQINTRVDQLGEITTSVTRTASSPMDPDTGNDSESIIVIVTDDDIDSDGDGLSDSLERTICTDPNDSDTDGDGIPDGVENVNNNGIVDAGETSPCNSDTDSDGMPDGWEVQYGLEPLINDANDDLDKDFVSNLKEYLSGTEPNNPDSIPNRAPTVPMINDPPSIPMIKNPGDNTEVCTLRPTLSINPSTDINGDQITYDFELYSDEALSDLIISISGIECLWSINVNLINYADYYWRARAIDEHGLSSQWSSVATFKVNSLEITIEIYASQDVFASATNLQTIEVKASDCPIKGASIEIPPGALTEYITITIGEATNGPPLPTGTMAIGRIIDLGPKGITFTIPVSIRIPYTDEDLEKAGVSDPSELEVFTYNTPALSWESVDIDNIDSQNNLLICKVDHFSLYSMGISELPDDGHGGSEGNGSNGNGCFIGIALYGANGTTDFLKKNKQNSERSDMRENMLKNVKNFITVFF